MEEKKKFNLNTLLLAVVVLLSAFCLYNLNRLSQEIDNLISKQSYLQSEINTVRNAVNSIYSNVDDLLKKENSLLSGVSYSIGELNKQNNCVALELTVVPKTISEEMSLSVSFDGKTVSLSKDGSTYKGNIEVGLFIDYYEHPLLTVKTNENTRTEYLEDIDISYLFAAHLPMLYANMFSNSTRADGKLTVDFGFAIESKPANENSSVEFISYSLIEERNGIETARRDITEKVLSSANENNPDYPETDFIESFEVAQNEFLKVYVCAEDSLGFIHKVLVYYDNTETEGTSVNTLYGGEQIFDSAGNLLFGDK